MTRPKPNLRLVEQGADSAPLEEAPSDSDWSDEPIPLPEGTVERVYANLFGSK